MGKKTEEEVLLTPAKIAENLGISLGKVKKAIEQLSLEPDSTKGVCKYYSGAALKKIKDSLQ